jgi:hypothetical protein
MQSMLLLITTLATLLGAQAKGGSATGNSNPINNPLEYSPKLNARYRAQQ